ncbi:MAG: trypsin-like peptidase domain-containing protein [Gemmatimonadales bacterium]|nr:MAG: trypsin-like peptidase domain-containing protein [Gemmatimonadales bacterium]
MKSKTKIVFYTAVAFLTGLGVASGFGWTSTSMAMPTLSEAPQVSEAAVAPARNLSESFVNVSEVVTPAVVRVEARRPIGANPRMQEIPEQFRRFFNPGPEQNPDNAPQGSNWAGGSGFIVSADGFILTNNHVIEGAEEVRIAFSNRQVVPAEVVGTDPFTDVAVVKVITEEPLPTLSLGDSDKVRPGEWVLAIGNPGFGGAGTSLDFTVTAGIVSARGRGLGLINEELERDLPASQRSLSGYAIEDFIQTDAVINPGNSGGPMVDMDGRVIGINSAIASTTGFYQGYGFAIPINLARRVMEDLVEYGHVQRPRLGVSINDITPEDAEQYELPSVAGILIQEVPENGPAAGKLEREDVIVAIEGKPVVRVGQLQGLVAMYRPGDEVEVTFYRGGSPRNVTIRLGEAEINDVRVAEAAPAEAAVERLGIFVSDMTQEFADRYGYEVAEGAIVSRLVPGSPAARRGLSPGLRILEINDAQIGDAADVRDALETVEGGSIVRFVVEAPGGTQRVVNVRMPNQ